MPTHYVYDEPIATELCQGDVLRRSDELVALLEEYFPYYGRHRDYSYFMVLTQTCDLVRRDGKSCNTPYISVAAVRPVEDALRMEAAKHQHPSLRGTNVIGNTARQKLGMFLESLMDNNRPGFFYLHTDASVGITEPSCAFLQLSVSFLAQDYEKCLGAKIAQLKDAFQAKLGWLIGTMYSRVATTEWNLEIKDKDKKVGKAAGKILGSAFLNYNDDQIRETLAELQDDGLIEKLTPGEIADRVKRKKIDPPLKQFKDQAAKTLAGMKLVDPVKGKAASILQQDEALRNGIAALFESGGVEDADAKAGEVMKLVLGRMREAFTEETFPDREKHINALVAELMADTVLKSFIK